MKQVLTSAGVLALSAASLCALDPEMTRQASGSPFSISGTVRGFYDDNINTAPDNSDRREDSFGFSVTPAVHVNLPFEQTFLSLGYLYTLSWYEDRSPRNIDQAHEFNAKLRHQFTPRQSLAVDDTFNFSSEPTIRDRSYGIITDPVKGDTGRSRSSAYHNFGSIDYSLGFTPTLGISLGYNNHWYDYTSDGDFSRSAVLDRIEHLIRADLRYNFTPKFVGIVGYSFGFTTFTDDHLISGDDPETPEVESGPTLKSDSRDSRSHYAYVGADYDITAKLTASARLGAQFSEYPDLDESSANPYADVSLSYKVLKGTTIDAGVRHARSATDVASVRAGESRPTLDTINTAIYAQLNHKFTRQLTGSLLGQYQRSTFNDGKNDDRSEYLWLFGANLAYAFDRHWSCEAGYNYDQLTSNVKEGGRSYDRNRVYVGVTARY
jgi:Putative beta-barrel porin 2